MIQDHLPAHTTPYVRARARTDKRTLVPSATHASWMSPLERHTGDAQKLSLEGMDYRTWPAVESAFRRAITYRNRESKGRGKVFRDIQRRWRSHRRPAWKQHQVPRQERGLGRGEEEVQRAGPSARERGGQVRIRKPPRSADR